MDLTTLTAALELILIALIAGGAYSYGNSVASGIDFNLEFYSAYIAILVNSMQSNENSMEVTYELPKDYAMEINDGIVTAKYAGERSVLKGDISNRLREKSKPTIINPEFMIKSEIKDGKYLITKERKT